MNTKSKKINCVLSLILMVTLSLNAQEEAGYVSVPEEGPWICVLEILDHKNLMPDRVFFAERDKITEWLKIHGEEPGLCSATISRDSIIAKNANDIPVTYKRIDTKIVATGVSLTVFFTDGSKKQAILSPDVVRGQVEFSGGLIVSYVCRTRKFP